jgi:glycosyltransferase involved in cell wall biosynthesis
VTGWLLVARANNYGLTRDAALLRTTLALLGQEAGFATTRQRSLLARLAGRGAADTIIHLERAHWRWLGAGRRNWLIPNQERFPRRHLGRLRHFDLVLAKSRHAARIFSSLGVPTEYLGFTSEDRLDPAVETDYGCFFHLAGASTLKGTETVLELWQRHPEWPELVLVQKEANAPKSVPRNVRLLSGYLEDTELKRLQNGCGIHLCPSRAEGWGHHIVEAMSAKAVVVTTDAPPMNEHVTAECGVPVPWQTEEPRHLGICYAVDPQALEAAIERLIAMPASDKQAMGERARSRFLDIDQAFRDRLARLLDDGQLPAGKAS